jgi:hypothetical protein
VLKTNVELHSYHALRVWITNKEIRAEVRKWFADNLFTYGIVNAGEMEIPHDWFMETIDGTGNLNDLSQPALTTIGAISRQVWDGDKDIACVIFAKKEEDVEHPDE